MTQTTAVRVESILESHLHLIPLMVGVDGESADIGGMTEAAQKIAAEIDALTRERDEARAEVARLRPGAEAWEALQAAYQGRGSSLEYAYSVACVERAGILRARAAEDALRTIGAI